MGGRVVLAALCALLGCLGPPEPGDGDGGGGDGGDGDDGDDGDDGACPGDGSASSAMADAFDDQLRGCAWRIDADDPGCELVENSAGSLVATLPEDGVGRCAYETIHRYDMTGDGVFVEVLTTPLRLEAYAFLEVRRDADNLATIRQVDQDYVCTLLRAGVPTTACLGSYRPDQHRWWRIAEVDGAMSFQFSTDGLGWSQVGTGLDEAFDVSSVLVSVGAAASQAPGFRPEARFDHYNRSP